MKYCLRLLASKGAILCRALINRLIHTRGWLAVSVNFWYLLINELRSLLNAEDHKVGSIETRAGSAGLSCPLPQTVLRASVWFTVLKLWNNPFALLVDWQGDWPLGLMGPSELPLSSVSVLGQAGEWSRQVIKVFLCGSQFPHLQSERYELVNPHSINKIKQDYSNVKCWQC